MKKTVSIAINQQNLVQNLKFSFTNRTTVLGELMQNARRAGASWVNFDYDVEKSTLTVSDDGSGIDSIEDLLTIAESGWDPAVKVNESPFGMGFLSALYSCDAFHLVSKCGSLSGSTAEALAFKDLVLDTTVDWQEVTSITLIGFELMPNVLTEKLKALAEGFPIPVLLDGEALPRPNAVGQGLDFVPTDIGWMHVEKGAEAGFPAPCKGMKAYLQGLPVYRSTQYSGCGHIVHLDPTLFFARMPDRDILIDQTESVSKIEAALQAVVRKQFEAMKTALPGDRFVEAYSALKEWQCLELLNDVDWIPTRVLQSFCGYPVCNTDLFGTFLQNVRAPVAREQVESGQVEIVELGDLYMETDGAAKLMFAWQRDCLVYGDCHYARLDSGHWLHGLVRKLNGESVQLEIVDESHQAFFNGHWSCLNVTFCEAYRLTVGDDTVTISDAAFYQGTQYGYGAILPFGEKSARVIEQAFSYRNSHDDYESGLYHADLDDFTAFIIANTVNDPSEALRQLLPVNLSCPALYNRQFVIHLDANGYLEIA